MRVLVFGSYDPEYSRNRVLLEGLRSAGAEVLHCRSQARGPLKYLRLVMSHIALRGSYDVMLVAFPGQGVMPLARFLAGRRPLVLDFFTSHYEGYVLDRRIVRPGSLKARWYRWQDRTAVQLADACLTDTDTHADWYAAEFGIPREKLHRVFVGTDERMIVPAPAPRGPFVVHFHGTFIPLQGTETIIRAAAMLADTDIRFVMIGSGQTHAADMALARTLDANMISFVRRVPYAELASRMAQAAVCLGIFGSTPKTGRVIPNKVFEALSARRAVITADTPAIRELLDDSCALLVPPGEPELLARAIMRLRGDSELCERLADAGHRRLRDRSSLAIIGGTVMHILKKAHGTH